jgi:hypothetical protein
MLIIASRRGFLVAFLGVAAGFLGVIGGSALGAGTKSIGIGFLSMGVVAWLLGRHEPERSDPCSLFFIPLRLYATVALAAGGLFLFVPNTDKTPLSFSSTPSPRNTKLDAIETRLRSDTASGSFGPASEKAMSYQKAIQAFEKISGIEGKVNVYLDVDGTDFKEAARATMYVQSANLKKYGDEGKKGLASVCLKMLRADFPKATCQVAARGPFLWGVQGVSLPAPDAVPVITVTSDSPRF